jgi:hypothetical protein
MKVYAAYGSNINLEQMARRCPAAVPIGKGWLMDYHLLFRGLGRSGVATVEPRRGRRVPILLWVITEECEAALDRYEGYPSLYRKEVVKVEGIEWLPNKAIPHAAATEVETMIYIVNHGQLTPPSQPYLDCIVDGYRAFGFHIRYLSEAVRRAERSTMNSSY